MSETDNKKREKFPLIPLRGIVVFPYMVVPLIIGRNTSVKAVMHAFENNLPLFLSAQKSKDVENPSDEDIFSVGCVSTILELINMPNGMVRILVEGLKRGKIARYIQDDGFSVAEVDDLETKINNSNELEALIRTLKDKFVEYISLNPKIPKDTAASIVSIDDSEKLIDAVMANIPSQVSDKQAILEENDINERLTRTLALVHKEIDVLKIEDDINKRVQDRMEKMQKKYFLNEQLKEIRKELDDGESQDEGIQELRERAKGKEMPESVKEKFESELDRLSKIPNMSPEYTVLYNYIEWLVDLPWGVYTVDNKDLQLAENTLEKDHYGLKEAKERIIDFIAVRQLNPKSKGPIICLVGPPGTGKTSLAKSIAHALNRNFIRVSLGGVRDEAEIRGHRRTYVGALPGKIVQMMKKAGSMNPVFLMDEIDKMSTDFRGDPSSALLEVLDPEQNNSFNDHYMSLDFDLSYVFFITTANNLYNIPGPLRDRMEIIEIPGYTELEKKEIAKKFLIPKQMIENGLLDIKVNFTDNAILDIVRYYTKEAGVRNLERNVGKVIRKIARDKVRHDVKSIQIDSKKIAKHLGVRKFDFTRVQKEPRVGVIAGLAWTEMGGDVLYIESSIFKGKGDLILTGQLGEVMQESAKIAFSFAKSVAEKYGIDPALFRTNDLHIHVPEGAIPKDGPSAGVTMISSIISTYSGKKARNDCAMTGEITLKGDVLPIGGLREKLLAAKRGGLFKVIVPKNNEKDISEMNEQILKDLTLYYVENIEEVLKIIIIENDAPAEKVSKSSLPRKARRTLSKKS
jgi:ATP-dependent Lon protease